jgi:signal transduction histidine kinase
MIETSSITKSLVEELRKIKNLDDLAEENLEWLAAHMTVTAYSPGEIIFAEGAPADQMVIILEGEVRAEWANDTRIYIGHAGQITGMLPYSRLTHYPSTGRAGLHTRLATLPKELFPEMLYKIPELGQRLVNVMSDRVREGTKADVQRDKLTALGKLSAGLAHELNNPASAVQRGAEILRESIAALRAAHLRMNKRSLSAEQRLFLAQLENDWGERMSKQQFPAPLDPLDKSDREEEIGGWLDRHGIANAWSFVSNLVDAGVDLPILENIASHMPADALSDVITRVSASFTASRLVEEIEHAASRISELVRAIKEYSYMDQMPEQEIDIHQGLENTLIILRHQLKNGINITREYDRDLPKVCAHGSELNQVWTNLIQNAIDAMNGKGELHIRTVHELERVLVEIGDNGPGIPAAQQNRIFEPFFTTKTVGEGLGLGLDTVYRIVQNHRGDVRFESRPGDTRFQVRLPFAKTKGGSAS